MITILPRAGSVPARREKNWEGKEGEKKEKEALLVSRLFVSFHLNRWRDRIGRRGKRRGRGKRKKKKRRKGG